MKKMVPNNTHREHVFIRALGITALLIVMLSSTASAAEILTIGVEPNPPVEGAPATIFYDLNPTVSNNYHNVVFIYMDGIYITGDSWRSFDEVVGKHDYATVFFPPGEHVLTATYKTWDPSIAKVETVATAEMTIGKTSSIPEFPSVAVPVIAVLGLVAVIGRKKE
jgi:hypothetical protein